MAQIEMTKAEKAIEIAKDTRLVCVFCGHEGSDDMYLYHCGEYGALMTRKDYLEYMGYDYFAE